VQRPLFSWRTLPAIPVAIAMLQATCKCGRGQTEPGQGFRNDAIGLNTLNEA